MTDIVVGGIIILILGFSVGVIIKAKKKGIKCIGCDAGATCGEQQTKGCSGSCSQGAKHGCSGCGSKG